MPSPGDASCGLGNRPLRRGLVCALVATLFAGVVPQHGALDAAPVPSASHEVLGPPGSDRFGRDITVLSNGNYVVTDPLANVDGRIDAGAVYLYDGATHELISTLVGASPRDRLGAVDGLLNVDIVEVGDSNFVVRSSYVDLGDQLGAATWVSGTSGLDGPVGLDNSLAGPISGVVPLTNGHYVTRAPNWSDGIRDSVGAVTWGDGGSGVVGTISTTNSLHGVIPQDRIGYPGVIALESGNFVVTSSQWDLDDIVNVGAATFGDGTGTSVGPVTAANSVHGDEANDFVGSSGVVALANGHGIVLSRSWRDEAGAATWIDGFASSTATVGATNSIVGSQRRDMRDAIALPLSDGDAVLSTPNWDRDAVEDAGAVTRIDGTGASVGAIRPEISLVGSSQRDLVGRAVNAVGDGSYVVASPLWDRDGMADAGAATWSSKPATVGDITVDNSLVGTSGQKVSSGGIAVLSSGDYVVATPGWGDGTRAQLGAATWVSGATGVSGVIDTGNSLHGTSQGDRVAEEVIALADGNYVVASPSWRWDVFRDAGAVTWSPGDGGLTGPVTALNSVHGVSQFQEVGSRVDPLRDGSYLAVGADLDGTRDTRTATWAPGGVATGTAVTTENSVFGLTSFFVTLPLRDDAYAILNAQGRQTAGVLTAEGTTAGAIDEFDLVRRRRIGTLLGLVDATPVNGDVLVTSTRGFAVISVGVPPGLVSIEPSRLADSRPSGATLDGRQQAFGALAAGSTFEVLVAGRGGIPTEVGAVSLSVIALAGADPGFVTVHACDQERPVASNLNYDPGDVVANSTLVATSATGSVCIYSRAAIDLVVDAVGFAAPSSAFTPVHPARLIDTRPGEPTVDGRNAGAGAPAAGSTTSVPVIGRGNIPAAAVAVAVNLTAVGAEGPGFVTPFPCGEPLPTASNLNYASAPFARANFSVVKLGDDGDLCLFSLRRAHLLVDVVGYWVDGSPFAPMAPARLFDTRSGEPTVDGAFSGTGRLGAGATISIAVSGRHTVPSSATSAFVNITITNPGADGFVTAWNCDLDRPGTSNVNYGPGDTIAAAAYVELDRGGRLCLYSLSATDLVVDINGYGAPIP